MTPKELALTIARILDNKKAEDVKVLEVAELTSIGDYFVIAVGTSNTHIKALSDEVEFKLKEMGQSPAHNEGYTSATWILKDYISVVVHLFTREADDFYRLEHLWNDAVEIDFHD